MDDTLPNWCTGCDRQIIPKRTLVPVPANRSLSPHHDLRTPAARSPVRTRIVIDQSPAPLYCSSACHQKDLENFAGRPNYLDNASSATSNDSLVSVSNASQDSSYRRSTPNSRSIAVLQRECGLMPLPAPTSETYNELVPRVVPDPARPLEYTSGVMMANRRMEAILPKPLKPGERPGPVTPVAGWTDGSQAWRASTYSFAPPPRSRADASDPNCAAYGSFVASAHRSTSGVVATAAQSAPASPSSSFSSSCSSRKSDLLSSFEDSFARRSSTRISLFSPGTSPGSSAISSPPRTLSSAGGMLLVPEVRMRPRSGTSGTSASLDSVPQRTRRYSCRNRSDDDEPECSTDPEEAAYIRASAPEDHPPQRPNIETRPWSYDNVRTYPVMSLPPLKEMRIVDGVEVEVRVPRPVKRLFTFAPVEAVKPGYS
ncbi:hypothetical protein GGX14DRAFT_378271 [Mycena pura]|uniref:Uncharacterized protein n=1 Tax=Mycena pura TaxID=153505 RepID=A0AAD6UX24_9AGAR|nr:hypothetical protein GGX14DRAFT_378271 [Mycena pura]